LWKRVGGLKIQIGMKRSPIVVVAGAVVATVVVVAILKYL
jgi:hypothetical protein